MALVEYERLAEPRLVPSDLELPEPPGIKRGRVGFEPPCSDVAACTSERRAAIDDPQSVLRTVAPDRLSVVLTRERVGPLPGVMRRESLLIALPLQRAGLRWRASCQGCALVTSATYTPVEGKCSSPAPGRERHLRGRAIDRGRGRIRRYTGSAMRSAVTGAGIISTKRRGSGG